MAQFIPKAKLRIPPQDVGAEAALLGSLCLRSDAVHEIIDIINGASFYSDKHRVIFEAAADLFARNVAIDLLSLTSRLREKDALETAGGMTYISSLVNAVPSASNVRHYAEIVQKKYVMRRLIEASDRIASLGFEESLELEELLDRAERAIFEVTHHGDIHRFQELREALGEAWERLDRLHRSRESLRGIPTGFRELDTLLSGFQRSDLIILAARPAMGKTSLALDIARQTSVQHGTPVGIFSLEMSAQQLVDRMLAAESRVDAWQLRTGRLQGESEFDKIRDSLDRLAKAPIFIDDEPAITALKMRAAARRLRAEKNLGLLIVDYLQLMLTSRQYESAVQQVTEISRSLKHLARELEVPVLAISQLSRAVEHRGGKPRLSDLRDSGSLEQDADVVMFIHREDKYNEDSAKPNIAEILVEKHRNGPTGKVELYFDDKKSSFLSIEKTDFGELEQQKSARRA